MAKSIANQVAVQHSELLDQVGSTVFGRNIKSEIEKLAAGKTAVNIMISNKPAAVVLSVNEYDNLVSIRDEYNNLLEANRAKELAAARKEFDELFALMQTAKSREVMSGMIHVTGEELASTYQPGRTENN